MKKSIPFLALCLAFTNILLAQVQFGPKIQLDPTLNCTDIESIDINNDGLEDLIISETLYFGLEKRISKSMNLGNGEMSPLTTITTMNASRSFIAKGDFNQDGWQDLVTYESSLTTENTGSLFILLNNTDTTFSRINITNDISLGQEIQVADMNNDGLDDIILAEDPRLSVFFNQSDLTFNQISIPNPNPTEHYTIEIADLYNDGFPEIIEGAFPLYIYNNNNGSITFDAEASAIPVNGSAVFVVATGDLDNDGFADIVCENGGNNELIWYKNLQGSFGPKQVIDTNVFIINDIDLKDINNDGKLDIITAYNQSGEIVWYNNNGEGLFSARNVIYTGEIPRPSQVHLTDLNNDGFNDIIWANDLSYHLNQQNLNINSPSQKSFFKLYPNPSNKSFIIQTNQASCYEIYDHIGRIITQKSELGTGENYIQHSLSSGVYYVKITNESQQETLKLLVN